MANEEELTGEKSLAIIQRMANAWVIPGTILWRRYKKRMGHYV